MILDRRGWLRATLAGAAGAAGSEFLPPQASFGFGAEPGSSTSAQPLKITGLKITPIALPDPPLLANSGCHGPYFLRTIVEIETDAGIVGVGEATAGDKVLKAFEAARPIVLGQNAFAFRTFAKQLMELSSACYAGVELACLDACGHATGRRACELLGGPVREQVDVCAYLFYRYAADNPTLLADKRRVDSRGSGAKALDQWGEVRTPEAMVEMAQKFRDRWGFRVFKLKGGVLEPDVELATMKALNSHFGGKYPLRIDPNARWTLPTAYRIGRGLADVNLEYYEDPVIGQSQMADVRRDSGLKLSTNMCVTRFEHLPDAVKLRPVDVVLSDQHTFGGITACQELGTMCETFGFGISQHSNSHAGVTMAAMITLAAVIPQLTYASDTHYPWLVDGADIIEGPRLEIRDGKMSVPSGPGLGVQLDRDKVARAHETFTKCGMSGRDDAATMKLIEPGWKRDLF